MTGRSARGFTLVEVMIALFVLALMAAMAWQGVDVVIRSRDAVQARSEALLRLQSTLGQWQADLQAAIDTQVVPGLLCDGASLRLTRRQPEGAQVVVWALRGRSLYRWTAAPVTRSDALQEAWLQSYQLQEGSPGMLRALDGVQRLSIFTFLASSNAWSNCQSTGNVGASGQQALPEGVRLQLDFLGEGNGSISGNVSRSIQLVHP